MEIIDVQNLLSSGYSVSELMDEDYFVFGRANPARSDGYSWYIIAKKDLVNQILPGNNLLRGSDLVQAAIDGANAPSASNVFATLNDVVTVNSQTLYGSNYGIIADGVTDNTVAFNNFMAACKAGQHKGELPIGTIKLGSKPNDIDFSWDLGGKGLSNTILLRAYNEAGSSGCLSLVGGSSGTRIHDMAVESAAGYTGGSMISVICPSSFAISGVVLENLWVSTFGSDTQTNTLLFDGRLKTTSPSGLRDLHLKNVHAFGATGFSVVMLSVVGGSWLGGGAYPAGGTGASSGGIQIGGTASNKSSFITLDIVTSGGLNLTNCWYMKLAVASVGLISGVSVNNDNSCSLTQVIGYPAGTVLGNWVDSGIRRPNAAYSTT